MELRSLRIQDIGDINRGWPPGPMSFLSLNCRGCGNAATIRELDVLVKTHIPKLLFLCETCQKSERV
jgi:hypothetical protein